MNKKLAILLAGSVGFNTACSTLPQGNDHLTTFDIRVVELGENTRKTYECILKAWDQVDSIICTLDAILDQKTRIDYVHNLAFHLLGSHIMDLENVLGTERFGKLKGDLYGLFEEWLNRGYNKKDYNNVISDANWLIQEALQKRIMVHHDGYSFLLKLQSKKVIYENTSV